MAAARQKEWIKKSLLLPRTKFPMRANAVEREPAMYHQTVKDLYQWQSQQHARPTFTLHDGPPFANGSLHMGHFLNKVLKDIINRYHLLRGYRINYIPGWDCHGLPIEQKALSASDYRDGRSNPAEIRRLSRTLALGAMADQQKDFQRWGILADWDSSRSGVYTTMDATYEAKQYDILRKMVAKKMIYRGWKPVYWSPSSQTALAEAELEYRDDHVSIATYIAFPVSSWSNAFPFQESQHNVQKVSFVIWTTTPWTIPANMGLAIHPDIQYAIVRNDESQDAYVVALDLAQAFIDHMSVVTNNNKSFSIVCSDIEGQSLVESSCVHPLDSGRQVPVFPADHVTTDTGTGVVHIAPAHGQEDYVAYCSYVETQGESLEELRCLVNEQGQYTPSVGFPNLVGQSVLGQGNRLVLEHLRQTLNLLSVNENHVHRYPYDWRTKEPVILRATHQWFATLTKVHAACQDTIAGKDVRMIPESARKRLEATLRSRNEWCISRQRVWGLPIPAFVHRETGEVLMDDLVMARVQELIAEHGSSDCWWSLSVQELLPPVYQHQASMYEKGKDTLDVWFDSGSSWYCTFDHPSDTDNDDRSSGKKVYLEGSDQHRGWFQSSLILSMIMTGHAPYSTLITHGFVLDEDSRKMSKSIGNTLLPKDFIEPLTISSPKLNQKGKGKKVKTTTRPGYGVDVLRYWVAANNYTSDVNISAAGIEKVSEQLRKVRNTARFLLGNLHDFNDVVTLASGRTNELPILEQYMLHQLFLLQRDVTSAYDEFAFRKAQHALSNFISNDLSGLYMETCKDRLYCDAPDSPRRRASQTVLAVALDFITHSIAPVVCFTAEEIFQYRQALAGGKDHESHSSVFQSEWMSAPESWHQPHLAEHVTCVRHVRMEFNRLVEIVREKNKIGSQLETFVTIRLPLEDTPWTTFVERLVVDGSLAELLLSSCVTVVRERRLDEEQPPEDDNEVLVEKDIQIAGQENMTIGLQVSRARGHKCPRCWKYCPDVRAQESNFCSRCAEVCGITNLDDIC